MVRPLVSTYQSIHTAIGGELLKLEAHAQSVDPNSAESVGGFASHLAMLEEIQEAHSHEEEQGLWPQIEARLPGITATFLFDHEGERDYMSQIQAALGELQQGSGDKKDAAARLYRYAVALSAHLIHHMSKEEALLYTPFADKVSEQEESKIIYDLYEDLPEDLVVEAVPWEASYQDAEAIAEDSDILLKMVRPEKASLIIKAIVNSLPPEKWGEVEKLRPNLATYRGA